MADQIFFTHVMKTGGTSVLKALRSPFEAHELFPCPTSRGDQMVAKTMSNRLLDLEPTERARIRLFSVHQPAWIAQAAAPHAMRVTVVREPVDRTVSHLRHLARGADLTDDLMSIYDDEGWRSRLVDHQCQMFATTPGDVASLPRIEPELLDDEGRRDLWDGIQRIWWTGVTVPLTIDRSRADAAIDCLAEYDVVGVTDDLPGFLRAVAARAGLDLPEISHANAAPSADAVPTALLARIEADTAFDQELYQRARVLAGVDG